MDVEEIRYNFQKYWFLAMTKDIESFPTTTYFLNYIHQPHMDTEKSDAT